MNKVQEDVQLSPHCFSVAVINSGTSDHLFCNLTVSSVIKNRGFTTKSYEVSDICPNLFDAIVKQNI